MYRQEFSDGKLMRVTEDAKYDGLDPYQGTSLDILLEEKDLTSRMPFTMALHGQNVKGSPSFNLHRGKNGKKSHGT